MRQLGDFAAWLGLILIVVGVVYYTPKLVEYVNDDTLPRSRGGWSRGRRGTRGRGATWRCIT